MNLNFETQGVNFVEKRGKLVVDEIATPQNICNDMSNLFDYTDCNTKIWGDIYCKTGNTLSSIIGHGVYRNNIFAICDNKQSQMLVCRKLYGKILEEEEVPITQKSLEAYSVTRRGQVYWISNWQYTVKTNYQDAYNIIKFVILKEMERTMALEWTDEDGFHIDNIIMNPPYNPSDLYIDFALLAKDVANDSFVSINPAKGINGKADDKNDKFREEVVPYIENAVFYPDSRNIFNISEWGGIVYYLVNKDKKQNKIVKTCCNTSDIISSEYEIHDEQDLILYNRRILSIIGKAGTLGGGFKQSLYVKNTDHGEDTIAGTLGFKRQVFTSEQERGEAIKQAGYVEVMQGDKVCGYKKKSELFTDLNLDKYKVITSIIVSGSADVDKDGKFQRYFNAYCIGPNQVPKGSFPVLRYFDTKSEAEYFISYTKTKLFKFLFSVGICGTTLTKEFFRFIPDPGKFDHIFTDQELYDKYGLTTEEQEIIESVIKERK